MRKVVQEGQGRDSRDGIIESKYYYRMLSFVDVQCIRILVKSKLHGQSTSIVCPNCFGGRNG